jgi:hypothetical protein
MVAQWAAICRGGEVRWVKWHWEEATHPSARERNLAEQSAVSELVKPYNRVVHVHRSGSCTRFAI